MVFPMVTCLSSRVLARLGSLRSDEVDIPAHTLCLGDRVSGTNLISTLQTDRPAYGVGHSVPGLRLSVIATREMV